MTPIVVAALTGFFAFQGAILSAQAGGISADLSAAALAKEDTPMKQSSPEAPSYPTYTVSVTGYNALPEQTDSDPSTTASGAFSNPDIIAARSVDLADKLPFGSVIAITAASSTLARQSLGDGGPNCGLGLVQDLVGLRVIGDSMHPRMRNKIDMLFDAKDTIRANGRPMNPALVLGICKNVQIAIVGHVDVRHMPRTQTELAAAVGLAALAVK